MSIYMVASKCSKDHLIAEKYRTVQSFKLHLLQKYSPCATMQVCQRMKRCWKPFC